MPACNGTNVAGLPCEMPENMVGRDGWCPTHRPGEEERRAEMRAKGGEATKAKYAGEAFTDEQLPRITTLDEAGERVDMIGRAVLTRRISHHEGASATRSVETWMKIDQAKATHLLVNELRAELDAKTEEIAQLRRQLAERTLKRA